MSLWTPTFNLLNPKVSGWGRRTVSAGGGGGGGETALSRIQAAFQNGDFAAYWGISDELVYTAVSRDVTLPSPAGGTAIMPDKAAFSGDETVSDYVARLGLTGRADTVLPGFVGYQNTGTFEPLLVQGGGLQPPQLENNNTDENLRIRSGFSGSSAHTIVVALRTNDTDFIAGVSDTGTSRYAGRVRNTTSVADTNIGTPSYRVEGRDVVVNRASDLYATGLNDFGWHVFTIEGMDLSTWSGDMIVGGFANGASSLNMDGSLAYVAIFPDDTITRNLAEAEAGALVGIQIGYPDVAYSYDFSSPDPNWDYWFGQTMTWNTLGPGTPAGSASFFAGSSSGQTGGESYTVQVEQGVSYTFKINIPLTSNGAVWTVRKSNLSNIYGTVAGTSVGDNEFTFTPTESTVEIAVAADWDNWAFVDDIAIFKTGTPAPF